MVPARMSQPASQMSTSLSPNFDLLFSLSYLGKRIQEVYMARYDQVKGVMSFYRAWAQHFSFIFSHNLHLSFGCVSINSVQVPCLLFSIMARRERRIAGFDLWMLHVMLAKSEDAWLAIHRARNPGK